MRTIAIAVAILSTCFMQEVSGDVSSANSENTQQSVTQELDSKMHSTEMSEEQVNVDASQGAEVEEAESDEADEADEADEEDAADEADEEYNGIDDIDDYDDEYSGEEDIEGADDEAALLEEDPDDEDDDDAAFLEEYGDEADEADDEDSEADEEDEGTSLLEEDDEAGERAEKDDVMIAPDVPAAEALAEFEAAEKKKYEDAVAAKNCDLLDNPTTFYKCKDKLKTDTEKAKEAAQKATEVLGKLSPLLKSSEVHDKESES